MLRAHDPSISSKTGKFIVLVSLFLFACHMFALSAKLLNIPFSDEWGGFSFHPLTQTPDLNWKFIFQFHNEHRIVLTKLQAWIFYNFRFFNFITISLFNFFIFSCLVLYYFANLCKRYGFYALWTLPLFASTLFVENHYFAFQSQFHFAIWAFIAAFFVSLRTDGWRHLSPFLAIISAYSFSLGVIWSGCIAIWLTYQTICNTKEFKINVFKLSAMAICIVVWFQGYSPTSAAPQGTLRFLSPDVWLGWIQLLAAGFGATGSALNWIGALICGLWLCYLILNVQTAVSSKRISNEFAQIFFLTLSLSGALWIISYGRSTMDQVSSGNIVSRYCEVSILLAPLTFLKIEYIFNRLRQRFFSETPNHDQSIGRELLYLVPIAALWISAQDSFNFSASYRYFYNSKLGLIKCVRLYYAGIGNGVCNVGLQADIKSHLDYAKEIDLPYAKENSP